MKTLDRRRFLNLGLSGLLAATTATFAPPAEARSPGLRFGPSRPFDFDLLRRRARALADRPHVPPASPAAEAIRQVDFDLTQKIAFRADCTLWPDAAPIRFFHLNKYTPQPVRIHVVAEGRARRVLYRPDCFDYGGSGVAARLPDDLGFAGFRLMDGPGTQTDWLAFLGASYFRSSGDQGQYGASARGIAVDTGLATPEEFPRFSEFWLEAPDGEPGPTVVHALLDGPGVTGAYRFTARRDAGAVIDVTADLFLRRGVERLGLAPLTSMFWYGENDRRAATDWRPEIHDSDGLALWTGGGERIWRPLVNPPRLQTNAFVDVNPRGFGLMQRDRDFDHYQDDGAFYGRRPGIWIEPRGDWGPGAVMLVEIPTDDEVYDNVVAFWQPAADTAPGDALSVGYRMFWRGDEPYPPTNVGRVVATRTGAGGYPGQRPRPAGRTKFVVDFAGGPLAELEQRFDLTAEVTASKGRIEDPYVLMVVGTDRWRAVFDLDLSGHTGGPVDLRCFIRLGDRTLSETWLYQHHPA